MKRRWWALIGDWTYRNKYRNERSSGSVLFKVVGKHSRGFVKRALLDLVKEKRRHNGAWVRFRAEAVPARDDLRVLYERVSKRRWRFRKVPRFESESEVMLEKRKGRR